MMVVVIVVALVVTITQENYLGESGFWADTQNKKYWSTQGNRENGFIYFPGK